MNKMGMLQALQYRKELKNLKQSNRNFNLKRKMRKIEQSISKICRNSCDLRCLQKEMKVN